MMFLLFVLFCCSFVSCSFQWLFCWCCSSHSCFFGPDVVLAVSVDVFSTVVGVAFSAVQMTHSAKSLEASRLLRLWRCWETQRGCDGEQVELPSQKIPAVFSENIRFSLDLQNSPARSRCGQMAQVTPASSTWPQLVLPQPENVHWWMVSSAPVHATSSIQIKPDPAHKHSQAVVQQHENRTPPYHQHTPKVEDLQLSLGIMEIKNCCTIFCIKS